MNPLIQPSVAQQRIQANLPPTALIDCPLEKCAGRILREPIIADRPFPPFNRAMMDGYAIRVADISKADMFRITAQAPAGTAAQTLSTEIGSCIEIMTGAVVPEGADCVVPYEETETVNAKHMRITAPEDQSTGDAIHPIGSDQKSGATLIESGRIMGAREISIAATCGYTSLKVSKLPSIAIVSTGDELVPVSETPEQHQIRRSNDHLIENALARVGFPSQQRIHLADEADSACTKLAQLIAENDIVIISGGISMGKKDFIPEALSSNGLSCHFHGVAQRPGKPFGYWSHQSCAVFALPGNPLSTLTCLHHYVIPSIAIALQQTQTPPHQTVSLVEPAKAHPKLTVYLPVKLGTGNRAAPCPPRNSGDLVSILESDGSILLPPADDPYPVGSEFAFYPWY